MRKTLAAAVAVAALFAVVPGAHAAGIWSQIPSGTTSDITGIAYGADGRFAFVTANGEIFTRQGDGSFARKFGPSGLALRDIAFQPGGTVGIAVGDAGQVLRSTDNGATWAAITGIPVSKTGTTFSDCSGSGTLGNVNSVRFASTGRVWIFAEGAQMAKSEPATAANAGASGTWVDANRAGDNTCKLRYTDTGYSSGIDDAFFVPANPDIAYICTGFFGAVFRTVDDLATPATKLAGDCGNGDLATRRMAGDASNPSAQWAVGPGGAGLSYMSYTADAWATSSPFTIVNPSAHAVGVPYDVAAAGGTVVAVGDGGMILNNTGGTGAFFNNAGDGALAGVAWHAVAVASAAQAAVGGAGGVLAVTTQANTTPDLTAPTGTIAGPASAIAGQPTQYTVNASDNAGGSGVNPGSFAWTANGVSATGNPASITFPSPGVYTLTVSFSDNAGNPASATITVTASAASTSLIPPGTLNPTPSKTVFVVGGSVTLSGPKRCVAPGKAFTATLAFKRRHTNARNRVIKVTKVYFFIDGKRVRIDRKAPFRQTLSVRSYKPSSRHSLKARAFMKVRHGASPSKSITTRFQVCSS